MKQYTFGSDYWQTGADLIQSDSGIITKTMGNQRPRQVDPPTAGPSVATPSRTTSGASRGGLGGPELAQQILHGALELHGVEAVVGVEAHAGGDVHGGRDQVVAGAQQQVGQTAGAEHTDQAAEAHQHGHALARIELGPQGVVDLAQLGRRDAAQHGEPPAGGDHVLHRPHQLGRVHQAHVAEVHSVERGRHGCLVASDV